MGSCMSAEEHDDRRKHHNGGKRAGADKRGDKKRKKKPRRGATSGKGHPRSSYRENNNAHPGSGSVDVPMLSLDAPTPQPILKQSSGRSMSGFSDFAPASALQLAAAAAAEEDQEGRVPLTPGASVVQGERSRLSIGGVTTTRSSTVSFRGVPPDKDEAIPTPPLRAPPVPAAINADESPPAPLGCTPPPPRGSAPPHGPGDVVFSSNPLLPLGAMASSAGDPPPLLGTRAEECPASHAAPPTANGAVDASPPPRQPATIPLTPPKLPVARVVIQGQLYDLEPLLPKHPGGPDILKSFNGRDATKSFLSSHGANPPFQALNTYLVRSAEL